jgi:dipeptide/tripeptide permease
LLVVWVSITLGRLVGLGDQWRLRRHGDGRVYAHAASSLATGALGMALLAASDAQTNSRTFWVGVALYGLGNGPCIGYCYELLNRLTVASDEGMSIMNVGLNLGASLVPYITSKIWASTALSYHAIIWIPFLLMVLPLPFMALARVAAAHQAAPAAVV